MPSDETCCCHTRQLPRDQTCRATRHAPTTRGMCHRTERTERRGIGLPHEAPASRPNVPSDAAFCCHTRQLPHGRTDQARHPPRWPIACFRTPPSLPARPTVWHSAAASALEQPSKSERSRARSGRLQCRVGRSAGTIPRFNREKPLLSRIVPRSGLLAQRGGRTAGEPCGVSGVCARVGAPSRRRTASRAGR